MSKSSWNISIRTCVLQFIDKIEIRLQILYLYVFEIESTL